MRGFLEDHPDARGQLSRRPGEGAGASESVTQLCLGVDRTGEFGNEPGHGQCCRRFPGPVRADEAERLPGAQTQIEAGDRGRAHPRSRNAEFLRAQQHLAEAVVRPVGQDP